MSAKDLKPSEEFVHCNHHHELDDSYQLVDFGTGQFVANVEAIPLLKALNEIGLKTRTHHISSKGDRERAFVSIVLDPDVIIEIRAISEYHSTRTDFDGKTELLISWKLPENSGCKQSGKS